MRPLESCSGPWAGHWIQGEVRGAMRFRLSFDGSMIRGSGVDGDGPFDLSGDYVAEDQFVVLNKRYRNLNVCYRGQWDGAMVAGHSVITAPGFYDTGEFEMWPEGDEEDLRIRVELQEAAKIGNSAPSSHRLDL